MPRKKIFPQIFLFLYAFFSLPLASQDCVNFPNFSSLKGPYESPRNFLDKEPQKNVNIINKKTSPSLLYTFCCLGGLAALYVTAKWLTTKRPHCSLLKLYEEKDEKQIKHVVLNQTDFNFDINEKDSNGETVLYKACEDGNTEIVRILLKYGPKKLNINSIQTAQKCDGYLKKKFFFTSSPLQIACQKNFTKIAKLLFEYGNKYFLQLNRIDHNLFSPYSFESACINGNEKIVKLFLKNKEKYNFNDYQLVQGDNTCYPKHITDIIITYSLKAENGKIEWIDKNKNLFLLLIRYKLFSKESILNWSHQYNEKTSDIFYSFLTKKNNNNVIKSFISNYCDELVKHLQTATHLSLSENSHLVTKNILICSTKRAYQVLSLFLQLAFNDVNDNELQHAKTTNPLLFSLSTENKELREFLAEIDWKNNHALKKFRTRDEQCFCCNLLKVARDAGAQWGKNNKPHFLTEDLSIYFKNNFLNLSPAIPTNTFTPFCIRKKLRQSPYFIEKVS